MTEIMIITVLTIIYLIGWIIAYVMLSRLLYHAVIGGWSNEDRWFCGMISLLSWMTVIFCIGWVTIRIVTKFVKLIPKPISKPFKKIIIMLDPKETRPQPTPETPLKNLDEALKG